MFCIECGTPYTEGSDWDKHPHCTHVNDHMTGLCVIDRRHDGTKPKNCDGLLVGGPSSVACWCSCHLGNMPTEEEVANAAASLLTLAQDLKQRETP